MKPLMLSKDDATGAFRVTTDGLDTGDLTPDEAIGVLAYAIYGSGETTHRFLKPTPRPTSVVSDTTIAEKQQAKAWLGVARLLSKIAPGWINRAPSAAEAAVKTIEAMAKKIDKEASSIDTLVEVRNADSCAWEKRYSAGKIDEGELGCFDYGTTSRTVNKTLINKGIRYWKEWRVVDL